jgi:WhiB family redox-sensing transcriptional regulator
MPLIQTLACDWSANDWRIHASCRDADLDLFFPSGVTGAAAEQIEAAKAVCRSCRVQAECLEFALITNQECGVWGGTSEDERRKLRRKWRAQRFKSKAS